MNLTSENGFSEINYSLFKGRQNIFLTIFITKVVVKRAAKILKIGQQIIFFMCNNIFNRNFSIVETSNAMEDLPEVETSESS